MAERTFPALEVWWAGEAGEDASGQLLAVIDDASPTAVVERVGGQRVFFGTPVDRDRALAVINDLGGTASASALDVPDEGWAERSQASLMPVRVGRMVVSPPWHAAPAGGTGDAQTADRAIIILPSMGFGTGHHASTRLCLDLLQRQDLTGRRVLDVGTGSGVLAIAATKLGASSVLAVDYDADALTSARENLELNGIQDAIVLQQVDLAPGASPISGRFDLVTANLTGAMLQRLAPTLAQFLAPGGVLIASGLREEEVPQVTDALTTAGLALRHQAAEDGWVGQLLTSGF